MHSPSILIVIPAHNAEATLTGLIDKINSRHPAISLLVIDDGSGDATERVAHSSNVEVIRHQSNLGKGAALKSGFAYAIDGDYDAVITLDADLQHNPSEISRFLENYIDNCTVLVGMRRLHDKMPFPRKISNSLSSFIVSLRAGKRIADSQSGFRLIPVNVLRNLALESSHFELEPELLIKAVRSGFRVKSVPISTIYHDGTSHMNPPLDTIRFLKMIWRSLFW